MVDIAAPGMVLPPSRWYNVEAAGLTQEWAVRHLDIETLPATLRYKGLTGRYVAECYWQTDSGGLGSEPCLGALVAEAGLDESRGPSIHPEIAAASYLAQGPHDVAGIAFVHRTRRRQIGAGMAAT